MFNSKLASLESRIARLESRLQRTALESLGTTEILEQQIQELLKTHFAYKGKAGVGGFVGDFRNHTLMVSNGYDTYTITVQPEIVEVKAENSWWGKSEKKHFGIDEEDLEAVIMDVFTYIKSGR